MSNEKFEWTDSKVKEILAKSFPHFFNGDMGALTLDTAIQNFKQEQLSKKRPLFITEDGKEMYLDNDVWWVAVKEDKAIHCGDELFDYGETFVNHKMFPLTKNYKYFSTKEAAEDWILINKPMLSVNDVVAYYNSHINKFAPPFEEGLKQLAKTKLDGAK